MTPARLTELRAIESRMTKGPWEWFGNTRHQSSFYLATVHGGRVFVMDFVRWGMSGGQPRFQLDQRMVPGSELVNYEVAPGAKKGDPKLYREDFIGINHPDALGIASLRNAAPEMLDEIERQAKRIEELEGALQDISDGPQPRDEYHRGIRCGVEDRGLTNSVYAAAEYAYDDGVEWCGDIAHRTLASKGGAL